MDVSKLSGVELDYWVAKSEGLPLSCDWNQGDYILIGTGKGDLRRFSPSSDWADGGPIIEENNISLNGSFIANWYARCASGGGFGDTALIAAMRAYVEFKNRS